MDETNIFREIADERIRQFEKHGDQSHLPDGTGPTLFVPFYEVGRRDESVPDMQDRCQSASSFGELTFEHILTEEYAEVIAEDDPAKLRTELVQLAAVATQWIAAIDKRQEA